MQANAIPTYKPALLLLACSVLILGSAPFVLPIGPCFYGLVDNRFTEAVSWPLIIIAVVGFCVALIWVAMTFFLRMKRSKRVDLPTQNP